MKIKQSNSEKKAESESASQLGKIANSFARAITENSDVEVFPGFRLPLDEASRLIFIAQKDVQNVSSDFNERLGHYIWLMMTEQTTLDDLYMEANHSVRILGAPLKIDVHAFVHRR